MIISCFEDNNYNKQVQYVCVRLYVCFLHFSFSIVFIKYIINDQQLNNESKNLNT